MRSLLTTLLCLLVGASSPDAHAAKWQVERVNHTLLTPPAGVTVAEMSGVTYLGADGDNYRFIAVQETKGELLQFDLTLSAGGAITAVSNVTAIDIAPTLDFEGIAFSSAARNSVFLADENNPGVREISLTSGMELQNVSIPPVFANRRGNLGFESLTRAPDGLVMWTANEEALTVDGDKSTASTRTNVRLLKLNAAGNNYVAGPQFAYQVEPIHGAFGSQQSGLSELVAMPDGTLLTLERSLAVAAPLYLNRLYEIDFAEATDVSVGALASGLTGQTYTPVGKSLLWSDAADGVSGQNLEGLALGPRLANGDLVLIGVVDNGDGFSANTIVAFKATAIPSADFDNDGDVDGADFLSWQQGVGTTIGAAHSQGDADRDGDVDGGDLHQWRLANPAAIARAAVTAAVPEPTSTAMASLLIGLMKMGGRRKKGWAQASQSG